MRKMNNNGRGSGLSLILILIVALLVAWLAVKNMGSLGIGGTDSQQTDQVEQGEDTVQQAQDLVDAINDKTQEQAEGIE